MKVLLRNLYESLKPILESRTFNRVSWVTAILAPLPLALQLHRAATAESVAGISLEAYSMLCLLHFIMALSGGIKSMNSKVFVTFSLTSIISFFIVVTTLYRGGQYIFF